MATRVLVTAIGTMNCTTIISELRNAEEEFYIIGTDINPRYCIANSKDVDEFYQFPSVLTNREKYVDFVLQFCVEHKIDVYYCVVDEEVETVAKRREEFEKKNVLVCLANTDAVVICHNKDLFTNWVEESFSKYNIRRFRSYEDIKDTDFPLFVKPVEGRASIGCRKISDRVELQAYKDCWDSYIVQEFIAGYIVAVDIVSNLYTSQIEISQRKELLRNSNGCGISVEIIDNVEIYNACVELVQKLRINGIVNVEFFVTGNNLKIIEVNPRLPAGIGYSCMAGLNVVLNALYIARGEYCKFSDTKIGAHYAKRYETYEIG